MNTGIHISMCLKTTMHPRTHMIAVTSATKRVCMGIRSKSKNARIHQG